MPVENRDVSHLEWLSASPLNTRFTGTEYLREDSKDFDFNAFFFF